MIRNGEKEPGRLRKKAAVMSLVAATSLAAAGCTSSGSSASSSAEHQYLEVAAAQQAADAKAIAKTISEELYNKSFPKGVLVPGILNGSVKIDISTVSGVRHGMYNNPILLQPVIANSGHPIFNRSWIGIPGSDVRGHVVVTPVQINLGTHGDTTETVRLNNPAFPIIDNPAVYSTAVSGRPDELEAFDPTGNNDFPSFQISSVGMK